MTANVRHNAGFTLVEMLVVVSIIALTTAIVISVAMQVHNSSKEHELNNTFGVLKGALQAYHEETGEFPVQLATDTTGVASGVLDEFLIDSAADHIALVYEKLDSIPASRAFLKKLNPLVVKGDESQSEPFRLYDLWGIPLDYQYIQGQSFPEFISAGPDKRFGTEDDIRSREQ